MEERKNDVEKQDDAQILTKTVGELEGYQFFVPSYQRGYRWTESEVEALLDDLNEFSDNGGKHKYCLQPLMVKRRPDGKYEVVDGQQRLTTIFIFMKLAKQEMRSAKPPYTIEYETRSSSETFLNELGSGKATESSINIDYHHITQAWKAIEGWLDCQKDDRAVLIPDLYAKLRRHAFFIWYEIPEESDPIEMFAKINLGKIPLTNAELIKALIMSKENFQGKSEGEIRKRQVEISVMWDRIEQGLREDSFWYFLNEKEDIGTRIDFLFRILAKKFNKTHALKLDENDKYFSFLVFLKMQKANPTGFVEKVWNGDGADGNGVEPLYSELRSWFENSDKYHVIGFLIECGEKVQNIRENTAGLGKSAVWQVLVDLANARITLDKKKIKEWSDDEWNGLQYGMPQARNVLLLFNIATLVMQNKKEFRFPFDLYKKGKWDIEHIHAIKDELPNNAEERKDYLKALRDEYEASGDKETAEKITEFLERAIPKDSNFQTESEAFYDELRGDCDELQEDNDIGNLAILNADINRGYKNATFMKKRGEIIKRDGEGCFIPLCTKNVFLKYYSSDAPQAVLSPRWSEDDRERYKQAMRKVIEQFFKPLKGEGESGDGKA